MRAALPLWIGIPLLGLLLGTRCAPPIEIAWQGPAEVWAPEARLDATLSPALGSDEMLRIQIKRGLDAPDAVPIAVDESDAFRLDADGRSGAIRFAGLPPGRSWVQIERVGKGGAVLARDVVEIEREPVAPDFAGPFAVGFHRDAITFPSNADGSPRTIDIRVWAPSDGAAGVVEDDAPLAQGVAALPTLLLSHGACGSLEYGQYLAEPLASMGWIVASMSHPPSDLNPSCASELALITAFIERANDVSSTLDWLLAESADPTSWLADAVDPERVGVSGHSFGGQTSLLAAIEDPRFRAVVPMAPAYTPVAAFIDAGLPLPVPVMVLGATLDTSTPFETDQAPLYPLLEAPRFLVELFDTGHLAFQDTCPFPPVCGDLTQEEAHALVRGYAIPFLGRYVGRNGGWVPRTKALPGSALDADLGD